MSKHTTKPLVRGLILLQAIEKSALPIKWLQGRCESAHVSPQMALLMARAGEYEGRLTGCGAVKWIRNADKRPELRWQECWRTADAAVLQPRSLTGEYQFT